MNPEIIIKTIQRGAGKNPVRVVVGKSAVPKASERNLLKRRIRAILSPRVAGSGGNIIVIVKKKPRDVDFSGLKNKILNTLDRIKK